MSEDDLLSGTLPEGLTMPGVRWIMVTLWPLIALGGVMMDLEDKDE